MEDSTEKPKLKVSKFLTNFLKQKRDEKLIVPEEFGLLDNSYIQSFHDSFEKKSNLMEEINMDEEENSSSDSIVHEADKDGSLSTLKMKEEIEDAPNVVSYRYLRMRNLPYNMKANTIKDIILNELGLIVNDLKIDYDPRTNLPAGTATITLPTPSELRKFMNSSDISTDINKNKVVDLTDENKSVIESNDISETSHAANSTIVDSEEELDTLVNEYANILSSVEYGSRKVNLYEVDSMGNRCSKSHSNTLNRKLTSNSDGRYFCKSDISSVKCYLCGETGHIQANCNNEPLPTPCHLCAGTDHEAMSCPNITCYRCGRFGHHSRNCTNYKNANNGVFCSSCGSKHHSTYACTDQEAAIDIIGEVTGEAGAHTVLDKDPFIRCMVCNALGHAVCNSYMHGVVMPAISKASRDGKIYCSNCGMSGHHVDFAKSKKKRKLCCIPRAEAYLKFPMLIDMLDEIEKSRQTNDLKTINMTYKGLIHSHIRHPANRNVSFDQIRKLFPSLENEFAETNRRSQTDRRETYGVGHNIHHNQSNRNHFSNADYHSPRIDRSYYDNPIGRQYNNAIGTPNRSNQPKYSKRQSFPMDHHRTGRTSVVNNNYNNTRVNNHQLSTPTRKIKLSQEINFNQPTYSKSKKRKFA